MQGFNEILVFASTAVSSVSSGVLVNGVGWRLLNYAALPVLVLAGLAALWLRLRRPVARG